MSCPNCHLEQTRCNCGPPTSWAEPYLGRIEIDSLRNQVIAYHKIAMRNLIKPDQFHIAEVVELKERIKALEALCEKLIKVLNIIPANRLGALGMWLDKAHDGGDVQRDLIEMAVQSDKVLSEATHILGKEEK